MSRREIGRYGEFV